VKWSGLDSFVGGGFNQRDPSLGCESPSEGGSGSLSDAPGPALIHMASVSFTNRTLFGRKHGPRKCAINSHWRQRSRLVVTTYHEAAATVYTRRVGRVRLHRGGLLLLPVSRRIERTKQELSSV
jgi:hypothetical protein